MFALIEDGYVILRKGGIYRSAKIYTRNRYLFANHGGGFIRLSKRDGGTSCPNVLYEDLVLPFDPVTDAIGRLMQPA